MGSPLSSGCAQPIRIVVPLRLSTTGCAGAHGAPGAVDKYLQQQTFYPQRCPQRVEALGEAVRARAEGGRARARVSVKVGGKGGGGGGAV